MGQHVSLKGGDKMQTYLESIASNLKNARGVKVGFLEGADYPPTDSELDAIRAERAVGRDLAVV